MKIHILTLHKHPIIAFWYAEDADKRLKELREENPNSDYEVDEIYLDDISIAVRNKVGSYPRTRELNLLEGIRYMLNFFIDQQEKSLLHAMMIFLENYGWKLSEILEYAKRYSNKANAKRTGKEESDTVLLSGSDTSNASNAA